MGDGSGAGDASGSGDGSGTGVAVVLYGEPITATRFFSECRISRTSAASEARSRMIFSSGGDPVAGYPNRRRVTCRSSMTITSGLTRLVMPSITITARGGSPMGYERKDDDSRGSAQTMVMVVLPSESCPQLMASTVLAVDSETAAMRRSTARIAMETGLSSVRS